MALGQSSDAVLGPRPWLECARNYFAGVRRASVFNETRWNRLPKERVIAHCEEETSGPCDDKGVAIHTLLEHYASSLGPDLPPQGVRICHNGFAVGYDVERRNPAWVAYRLRASEQRHVEDAKKHAVEDPWLANAEIMQTSRTAYEKSGYQLGHLAPSLHMSFFRNDLNTESEDSPGPWESSYFLSSIAPQSPMTNKQAWQELEEALHTYARQKRQDRLHDVFVITGLGYWNNENPLEQGDLIVPSFYWTVACDMKIRSSFAVIADNDIDADIEGWEGWPTSVFRFYSAADVERFFHLRLGLPPTCNPSSVRPFIESQHVGRTSAPKPEALPIEVIAPKTEVSLGETVPVHLKLPFHKDLPVDGGMIRIVAPEPKNETECFHWLNVFNNFRFHCRSLSPHSLPQLPSEWTCDESIPNELHLAWEGPIKGGAFALDVYVTAPSSSTRSNNWTVSLEHHDKVLERLVGVGSFQLHASGLSALLHLPKGITFLFLGLVVVVAFFVYSSWYKAKPGGRRVSLLGGGAAAEGRSESGSQYSFEVSA